MSPERMQRMLLEGSLDVGLCISAEPTVRVDSRLLIETRGRLVCGQEHPLFQHRTIEPSQLEEYPFVVPQFLDSEHLPALDGFVSGTRRRIGATVELMDTAIQLVIEGAYLGYFPEVAIRCELNHDELRVLSGLHDGPKFRLYAMSTKNKHVIDLLIDTLEVTLAQCLGAECEL